MMTFSEFERHLDRHAIPGALVSSTIDHDGACLVIHLETRRGVETHEVSAGNHDDDESAVLAAIESAFAMPTAWH